MRRHMRPLAVALSFALASILPAQQTLAQLGNVRVVAHAPMCNPFARRFDPVWVNGWGWTMPRVGWHALYPTVTYGLARGLHAMGVNAKVAAIGASVGVGLVPHLRQASLGLKHGSVYELNAPDWIFDLWNRSLPSVAMLSTRQHTTRDLAIYAVGDLTLSCFASP